eukprot:8171904-Pyramimonas_sp.AAC.2
MTNSETHALALLPRGVAVSQTLRSWDWNRPFPCPASKSCRYQGTLPRLDILPLPGYPERPLARWVAWQGGWWDSWQGAMAAATSPEPLRWRTLQLLTTALDSYAAPELFSPGAPRPSSLPHCGHCRIDR